MYGQINEREQFFTTWSNNYLSRGVEFLQVDYNQVATDDFYGQTYVKSSGDARIQLKIEELNDGNLPNNLYITIDSKEPGLNQHYYNVILYKNTTLSLPAVYLQTYNGQQSSGVVARIETDDEQIFDISNCLKNDTLLLQLWKGSTEEQRKNIELTDCLIRRGEKTFLANINVLAVSSLVIYNMIQDLQQQYDPQNPLHLTELFRGFEDHEIHTYLCFVYNPYCTPTELQQILSLLKISVKLDNQGLIQRVLDVENLGSIVKEQIVQENDDHPCYVQNVLNFAKEHDFHQLMVFCSLEILSTKQNSGGDMSTFVGAYGNL